MSLWRILRHPRLNFLRRLKRRILKAFTDGKLHLHTKHTRRMYLSVFIHIAHCIPLLNFFEHTLIGAEVEERTQKLWKPDKTQES